MSKNTKKAEKYNQYVQCVLFEQLEQPKKPQQDASVYTQLHEGMELLDATDGSVIIGDKEVILKNGIIEKVFNAITTDQQLSLLI